MDGTTSDGLDSVVLRFFVGPNGELRCRASDVYTGRTWIVPAARAIQQLLQADPSRQPATEESTP